MQNLRHNELPPRAEGYDSIRSPEADLMDTVAHLQLEVEADTRQWIPDEYPLLRIQMLLVGYM